jgi:hypothetical protein
MKLSDLFGKDSDVSATYKRFKKAMERNHGDYGLKAQFIKFCLLNRFTNNKSIENYIAEALALFETIENDHGFDIQCHYLVGKYYQEDKNYRKAYQIYLTAIRRFNQYVAKHPNLKNENSELAYSISLNLMILQSNPIDPEVEKCFKIIHKSYALHVKRFEFENEMAKPAPDKARIKQLKEEVRLLKAEEEKEISAEVIEKSVGNLAEYDQFKKEMESNPDDYSLKVQFIKFCLKNRFTNPQITESHIAEVLALFKTIENAHGFDLDCHYQVGKFYEEEKDDAKAYEIYHQAIKRFNQYAVLATDIEPEKSELAYSVATSLLNIQSDPADPEVEKCFKIIRKPYPIVVKLSAQKTVTETPEPEVHGQLNVETDMGQADEEKVMMAPQIKDGEKAAPAAAAGKAEDDSPEYDQLKKDMESKPDDYGLKTQFVKFCLLNRSTNQQIAEGHIAEALKLFKTIENAEGFDIECHYLVGKYYQEDEDNHKAHQIYLNTIKRFNQQVVLNPNVGSETSETAYTIALNLIILQPTPAEPELEKYFKFIQKSYALYVKRFELEEEMAKPEPDKEKIKQLKNEIQKIKTVDEKDDSPSAKEDVGSSKSASEKETLLSAKEKTTNTSVSKMKDKNDIFSKLLKVPSPFSEHSNPLKDNGKKAEKLPENKDFFFLSPVSEVEGVSFMVFLNHNWDGPFTISQLRTNKHLDKNTWVCKVGSQLVTQAYEVSDLQSLIE